MKVHRDVSWSGRKRCFGVERGVFGVREIMMGKGGGSCGGVI